MQINGLLWVFGSWIVVNQTNDRERGPVCITSFDVTMDMKDITKGMAQQQSCILLILC